MDIRLTFILFIIYSFIGWILEILYTFVKEKKIINRGFLIGPYCPIYGIGCILIISLLQKYKSSIIVLFVMSIIICMILEYFTSYILEKLFNARWWNYSNKKFNINGRICLELLIPFGMLGCFMVYVLNPFINNILLMVPTKIINIISILMGVVFMCDIILSFVVIKKINISTHDFKKDNTEEITQLVKDYILKKSKLQKRIIESFPNVKFIKKKK